MAAHSSEHAGGHPILAYAGIAISLAGLGVMVASLFCR